MAEAGLRVSENQPKRQGLETITSLGLAAISLGASRQSRLWEEQAMCPHEEDFRPDEDGLRVALDLLIAARSGQGLPHIVAETRLGLPTELPEDGLGAQAALELLAGSALEHVTRLDHPGFLAHMDPPTPWQTWAATLWAAAFNQNLLHPDTAPSARQLEQLVIDWLAPTFGMNGGHFVPGSTVANLTALWGARELTGARRVVASTAAHVSIRKATNLLGLEMVEVPVDRHQQIRLDLLPKDLTDSILVLTSRKNLLLSFSPTMGGSIRPSASAAAI